MNTFLRVGLVSAVALCLVSLLALSPASAGSPLIEEFDFVINHDLFANCGDFQLIADGAGHNRITTFFDNEGNPIRVAFQGRYKGTITNSVTGAFLTDDPSVANITFDLIKGTQTNIGAFFTVTTPGDGVVLIEAGRIVFDGNGPPIFIAGPHLPGSQTLGILCDALR
jgi:hypothetical protein